MESQYPSSSQTSLEVLGYIDDIKEIIQTKKISFKSAKDLLNDLTKWKRLSFGCQNLNNCVNGGLIAQGITEIYGESGSGKTQILLQLSLMVQLSEEQGGLNRGTIFISTEHFPAKRLFQLIKTFKEKYPLNDIDYGKNILIKEIMDDEILLKCVQEELPNLMESRQIGLIVIDSIAGTFRTETDNLQDRADLMRKLVNGLLFLIDKYQCIVVCSNQIKNETDENEEKISPSLGLAWSNLIQTRIKISRFCLKRKDDEENISSKRKFEVSLSSSCAQKISEFQITSNGIIDP